MTQLRTCRPLITALALGVLLAPATMADPPADKGKPAAAAQAQDKGKPQAPVHDGVHQGDKGKADDTHGQVVSTCNHRANEKKLQGKDRQEYVEWCTDRGERYQYDDRRYDGERSCYRKAGEKGLSGDVRRAFVEDCLRRQEKNR